MKETVVTPEVAVPTEPTYPNRTTLKAISKRLTALSIPVQVHGANGQIFFTDAAGTVELEIHKVNELSTAEWIAKAKAWSEGDRSFALKVEAPASAENDTPEAVEEAVEEAFEAA